MARVGSKPVYLAARRVPTPPPRAATPPPAVRPTEPSRDTETSKTEASDSSIPVAQAVRVEPAGVTGRRTEPEVVAQPIHPQSFQVGQAIRLVGMSDFTRNGLTGTVSRLVGHRAVVHLAVEDKKITVKTENLELLVEPFPVDTLVTLKGLRDTSMNGEMAVVVEQRSDVALGGRVQVRILDDAGRQVSVKPENLEVIPEYS